MDTILSVDHINIFYGPIHAVKDVSFTVNRGEIVSLIGANGAGKSTTLNTISGLRRSKTGSITFEGENISALPANVIVKRGLVQVPEGRRIFLKLTVEENLEMGAFTQPLTSVADGLERAYARFPRLKERRRQIAGTLSGGEQQMLAMGRAMMSTPKLLMLDEPSMGLAPILVDEVFDIIRSFRDTGTTILLVEQNATMALEISDRAYVLETGRVALAGPGEELASSARIRKAYLGG
jgi:branched-chain amino acid transport system ATP-binding protein